MNESALGPTGSPERSVFPASEQEDVKKTPPRRLTKEDERQPSHAITIATTTTVTEEAKTTTMTTSDKADEAEKNGRPEPPPYFCCHFKYGRECGWLLYLLLNVAAGLWGGFEASPFESLGFNVYLSRITSKLLLLNVAVAIVTSSRLMASWLRSCCATSSCSTVTAGYVSDDIQTLHKMTGLVVILAAVIHVVGHCISLAHLRYFSRTELDNLLWHTDTYVNWTASIPDHPIVEIWATRNPWLLTPYWTGWALVGCLVLLGLSGTLRHLNRLDRHFQLLFSIPHGLASYVMGGLLIAHGSMKVLGESWAPLVIGLPLALVIVLYVIVDRWLLTPRLAGQITYTPEPSLADDAQPLAFLSVDIPLAIQSKREYQRWRNSAGHYVLLYCPAITRPLLAPSLVKGGLIDWHPFSICDILEESKRDSVYPVLHLKLLISVRQGWTLQLDSLVRMCNVYNTSSSANNTGTSSARLEPLLYVRGPYRSGSASALLRKHVLLVATNSGITPMFSMWKHICRAALASGNKERRIVHLLWCATDAEMHRRVLDHFLLDPTFLEDNTKAISNCFQATFWVRSNPAVASISQNPAPSGATSTSHMNHANSNGPSTSSSSSRERDLLSTPTRSGGALVPSLASSHSVPTALYNLGNNSPLKMGVTSSSTMMSVSGVSSLTTTPRRGCVSSTSTSTTAMVKVMRVSRRLNLQTVCTRALINMKRQFQQEQRSSRHHANDDSDDVSVMHVDVFVCAPKEAVNDLLAVKRFHEQRSIAETFIRINSVQLELM